MKWLVKHANILDEEADILICSANVSLNLSGGVGGALLQRYGPKLQEALHAQIAGRSPRAAQRGEIFVTQFPEMPWKAVVHAVAVDGWYQTTEDVIREIINRAMEVSMAMGAKKVALSALATGYGNLTLERFAGAVNSVLQIEFEPIEDATICVETKERADELSQLIRQSHERGGPSRISPERFG
ncbi:MAG TPA: macro domain-containing protein [Chthoniobacteraceae bacterium]|nr:macro domain-containing protein [Chthoniobacteraceae bacterium]